MNQLEQRIILLAQAIGVDVRDIKALIGLLANLTTTDKTSLVNAINEVKATADAATTGGANQADIDASIAALRAELLGGAGTAYDTFKELEDLLVADATITQALTTAVGNRIRYDDVQTLTQPQKLQAGENLGIGNVDHDFAADYVTSRDS